MGTEAKVLDGLTGVLGSTEENGVGTGRCAHGQLVECEALTTSSGDPGTGGGSESERGNRDLGDLEQTVVVSDAGDCDNGLALVLGSSVLVGDGCDDLGEGDRRTVDLAHHQSAENSLVEVGIGPSGQKLVELYEEGEVRVVGLLHLAVARPNVMLVCIVLVAGFIAPSSLMGAEISMRAADDRRGPRTEIDTHLDGIAV